MTAALYALAATLVATLATRAWLEDRDHPARRAFMGLGWTAALAWLAFALAMLPGMSGLRFVHVAAGTVAPAFALRCVDLLLCTAPFAEPGARPSRLIARLPAVAALVGGMAVAAHLTLFRDAVSTSPAEATAGVFAWALLAAAVIRVFRARARAALEVERRRLSWLAWTGAGTMGFGVAEWWVRQVAPVDPSGLAFFDRGMILQGALPPVSAVLAALSAYVLHHTLAARRLIALQEVLTRIAVLGLSALVLVAAHALSLRFVALARFPLHSSFLLVLVSAVYLSVWQVAHRPLHEALSRRLRGPGQELFDASSVLVRELPGVSTAEEVAHLLTRRLYGGGRFRRVAVYLHDASEDAFQEVARAGEQPSTALRRVGPNPLVPALRASPLLRLTGNPSAAPLADALDADVAIALRTGDAIVGWLALRDATWSDGLTDAEQAALMAAVATTSRVLHNLQTFRRAEEEQRLAALGTMSAGLAHEIRNPLAGLKGAAQLLQSGELPDDARELLDVVVDEVDRLNRVVSRFLDLARPVAPAPRAVQVKDLVHRAATLGRASAPPKVRVLTDVDPDLPTVRVDPELMLQVLLNLVQNALQAVDQVGRVTLAARRRDAPDGRRELELAVTDDGPGLSDAALANLFTPFHTTRASGTGLGLAICQRIVVAHGGRIEAHNREDGGAAVTVRLPLPVEG